MQGGISRPGFYGKLRKKLLEMGAAAFCVPLSGPTSSGGRQGLGRPGWKMTGGKITVMVFFLRFSAGAISSGDQLGRGRRELRQVGPGCL